MTIGELVERARSLPPAERRELIEQLVDTLGDERCHTVDSDVDDGVNAPQPAAVFNLPFWYDAYEAASVLQKMIEDQQGSAAEIPETRDRSATTGT